TTMTPVFILLQTVFLSIVEVFLLCLAGYLLARRGILDKKTQKQINRLNVSLFTPSLLFSKVAFFLSPAKLRELWIIPIVFVVVTAVSMAVSFSLGWLFRLKRSQRSFAMAAAMFMNSNSLPIALMQSLVVTVDGLKWDDDDTKSAMLGRALTYLVLYSTMGMVLRWSYGVHLLSQADPDGEGEISTDEHYRTEAETSPLLPNSEGVHFEPIPYENESSPPATLRHIPSITTTATMEGDADESILTNSPSLHRQPSIPIITPPKRRPTNHLNTESANRVFFSFPNTPSRPTARSPASSDDNDSDSEHDDELPTPLYQRRRAPTTPTSTALHSFFRRTWTRIRHILRTLNEFMTVPLWAALASLIVALTPPLQHILKDHSSAVTGALTAAGNCSIPLTLVVLGAYFHVPPKSTSSTDGDVAGGRGGGLLPQTNGHPNGYGRREISTASDSEMSLVGSVRNMFNMKLSRINMNRHNSTASTATTASQAVRRGETRTVAIAVLSRMVIVPALLIPLMALSAKYDIPSVFDDPVFVVSIVLLISSPPALTLAQITQAASGDAFERLISRTVFWAYCIVTPPATIIYVVIGLLLAKL
ncbi:hypothetical protein BD410DRAFT_788025, partial [Rickenella mellea]